MRLLDTIHVRAITATVLAGAAACSGIGCQSSFQRIDARVDELLQQTTHDMGGNAPPAQYAVSGQDIPEASTAQRRATRASDHPTTNNPSAEQLTFNTIGKADDLNDRLQKYNESPEDAQRVDLRFALTWSAGHAREYAFAAEEYVLAALRSLVQRHMWGPRFFDDVSANLASLGENGFYDTSLALVNEFRVSQRLPYGGEVSARALASAVEDLHQRVSSEDAQNATLILEADIPLLRGAGLVAQEDRIQAERSLVYAARTFEQFRRQFFFDIIEDYLNLVLQQQAVHNAEKQVDRLLDAQKREETLYNAGREPYFQAALAAQSTASAQDTLNSRRESYRLAVDRFKVRIGLPADRAIVILPTEFDPPIPDITISQAVQQAFLYRLDLQNQRDSVDDSKRQLDNAANNLLPDLNLTGSVTLPTDPDKQRAGVDFSPDNSMFRAGVVLSLPLDREIERLNVRQAQIAVERAIRSYDQACDDIAVDVRSAVRQIDRDRYALLIQERSVEVGVQRQASIDAAPDRATIRDINDAATALSQAQDRRDSARRDLQVASLNLLLVTGQLRVNPDGSFQLLTGMKQPAVKVTEPLPQATTVPGPPPPPPEVPDVTKIPENP